MLRSPALVQRRGRRRAGVFRRALRRQALRLRDPRRVIAIVTLAFFAALAMIGLIGRGEQSGVDAQAYWAGVRIWINGGDPYHPSGPFLPYVYAPWLLPLFIPWALLPWDVAWFFWRGSTLLLLMWTIHWAYSRRPFMTTFLVVLLAAPIAANLETGNITLLLTIGIWGAQFAGPRMGGLLWALATSMKWVPAPSWILLAPKARGWGLAWLVVGALFSVLTLQGTISQLELVFGFPRPPRIDYLVLFWALVPWFYRREGALDALRPSAWPATALAVRSWLASWGRLVREDPSGAAGRTLRWLRSFVGLGPGTTPAA